MEEKGKTYAFYEASAIKVDNELIPMKEIIIIVSKLVEDEKIEFFLCYHYECFMKLYLDTVNNLDTDIERIIKTLVELSIRTELLPLKKISFDGVIQLKIAPTKKNIFVEMIHFKKSQTIRIIYNVTKNDELKLRLNLIAQGYQIDLS